MILSFDSPDEKRGFFFLILPEKSGYFSSLYFLQGKSYHLGESHLHIFSVLISLTVYTVVKR